MQKHHKRDMYDSCTIFQVMWYLFCEKIKHNLACYSLILKLSLSLLDAFMSDGEKAMSDLCTMIQIIWSIHKMGLSDLFRNCPKLVLQFFNLKYSAVKWTILGPFCIITVNPTHFDCIWGKSEQYCTLFRVSCFVLCRRKSNW